MAGRSVGVIGLGSMGMGAARSLLRAGFAAAACDVRRDALDAFAAAGGVPCASPAELGAKAGVVAIFVVNAEQTEGVLFGANGAAATMAPGSVVILCVTAAPDYAERLGERLAERDLLMLDAPVSGGMPNSPIERYSRRKNRMADRSGETVSALARRRGITGAGLRTEIKCANLSHGGDGDERPAHHSGTARMILGCIADDFTGATDLGLMLVRAGMRTVQTIGVPRDPAARRGRGRRGHRAQVAHDPRRRGGLAIARRGGVAACPRRPAALLQVLLDLRLDGGRQHRAGGRRPARRARRRVHHRLSGLPGERPDDLQGPSLRRRACCSRTRRCGTIR